MKELKRFEYVMLDYNKKETHKQFEDWLNDMGERGWELVWIENAKEFVICCTFKREK